MDVCFHSEIRAVDSSFIVDGLNAMQESLLEQFRRLQQSGSTDVFDFLHSNADVATGEQLLIVLADQHHRWLEGNPLSAEGYLERLPQFGSDPATRSAVAFGEFQARMCSGVSPSIEDFVSRFPDLGAEFRVRLEQVLKRDPLPEYDAAQVDRLCDEFEAELEADRHPEIDGWLARAPEGGRDVLLREMFQIELWWRRKRGEHPAWSDYVKHFPDEANQLLPLFELSLESLSDVVSNQRHSRQQTGTTWTASRPNQHAASFISNVTVGDIHKGRYRLLRILGEGNFGLVYLAYDEELQRQVAVKVPAKVRFTRPEDVEQYLAEARTVANLDHPHIVAVYDVGRTQDGSIYVVSKFIEGPTLAVQIRSRRPDFTASVQILEMIALALEHAHARRIIHRDVKPANILLEDATGRPYLADFGLAIRDDDFLIGGCIAGTPAYMSPEQSSGEGHRLDGRSDVFSLGVVFYELLTGLRPFVGNTIHETLQAVASIQPTPPRFLNELIPEELERICLKALSKRVSDRYRSAAELADDLRAWLSRKNSSPQISNTDAQVVHRGLRSFDANDADFFLDLLPGTRNREGLPESIAFWKQRIEETDTEKTFSVGLLYGPSGCGKSSLVKAGLLPHLSKDVIAIYLESTPEDTETRILLGLQKQFPELSDTIGLKETLARLRRQQGKKVVVIIDQFEQWLHANRAESECELVQALRQCNGGQVQAILMVRDDFAMAAARFMKALETRIVEGFNFATVDLFDIDHAVFVLTRFGQAFGKLPANSKKLSHDEEQFVRAVADGLARDGRVVSVHLSLFIEMLRNKPWTLTTLQQIGGTEGMGTNFLEETFSSREANPEHRLHEVAARRVLGTLLPEVETDIKGHMRSQQELLEASGYAARPSDFTDLLRILDGELRLITPTDPEGDSLSDSHHNSSLATRYYQLTHDYLVPSLREWLTHRQKQTRKGRAELLLAERSKSWDKRPENRRLPSRMETLRILAFTDRKNWTAHDKAMINRSVRFHGVKLLLFVGVGAAAVLVAVSSYLIAQQEKSNRLEIENQVMLRRESLAAELARAIQHGYELLANDDYSGAAVECQRVKGMLVEEQFDETLTTAAAKLETMVDSVSDFEVARIQRCGMPSCQFDYHNYSPERVLARLGLHISTEPEETLVASIRQSTIKEEILAALDDWTWVLAESKADPHRQLLHKLTSVCNSIDPDPQRMNLRISLSTQNVIPKDLSNHLADQVVAATQPAFLVFSANAMAKSGNIETAIALLENAAKTYPADFWINLRLAEMAGLARPPRLELKRKHIEIARVLRPLNSVILHNLASCCMEMEETETAKQLLLKAIELNPSEPFLQHSLAILFAETDQEDRAFNNYQEIIKRFSDFVPSHVNLAILQLQRGEMREARRLIDRALSLKTASCSRPEAVPGDHYNLGLIMNVSAIISWLEEDQVTAFKDQEKALELLREYRSHAPDGNGETNLERQLRRFADWAGKTGNTPKRRSLLSEAAGLENAKESATSKIELAALLLYSGETNDALEAAAAAVNSLSESNKMSANILRVAALIHAEAASPSPRGIAVDDEQNRSHRQEAIRLLERAVDCQYFSPVMFANLLQGTPELASLRETAEFHILLVNLYKTGFVQSPELLLNSDPPYRYNAACAALQAAGSQPVSFNLELNSAERFKQRLSAYQWLHAELLHLHSRVASHDLSPEELRTAMTFWQSDIDLAPVRDKELLHGISPEEDAAWRCFWDAVQVLVNDPAAPPAKLSEDLISP